MRLADSRGDQLARIQAELADARARAHRIAAPLEPEVWGARPSPEQWSVAECLMHLNLTSRAFLPLIKDAIDRGRERGLGGSAPYRMDLVGWLVWWATTVRLPIKTTEPFVPARGQPRATVLSDFDVLQNELVGYVEAAAGLELGRLRIVSPFDSRLTYNLYACLRVIPAHQRLHLRQAGRVVRTLRRRRPAPGVPSEKLC